MGWARLDDGFHDHPKLFGLELAAVGLFTVALTWAHRHLGASSGLPGHIPHDLPARFAGAKGAKLAAALERARLWDVEPGLGGWVIHDFTDYLPKADRPQTADEVRKARSEAGARGAAARWSAKTEANEGQTDSKLPSESDSKPMPPTRPDPTLREKDTSDAAAPTRPEVESLCQRLHDRIVDNGSKARVNQAWRDSCRLMLDRDERDPDQVAKLIDWCQADEFWRANILSMSKFREQYDKLRLASERDNVRELPRQQVSRSQLMPWER